MRCGSASVFLGGLVLAACLPRAQASLTVLVGEPFGNFGTMMPVGHVSIYLDRVCAETPTRLRMCRPGEPQGVALARLDKIGSLDWIASPILDFLYGTDDAQSILPFATRDQVTALREQYRQRYLREEFPDSVVRSKQSREWWETVGVTYSRKVWGYQLLTTRAQDEAFVAKMNAAPNRHAYRLHKMNCADFVADAVNFYYPGTVKSDHVADFALMTPKQVARAVEALGQRQPELQPAVLVFPQLPGTSRRSRPARGAAEMILKTKRYAAILSVIQPELVVTITALYLKHGRWQLGAGAQEQRPASVIARALTPISPGGLDATPVEADSSLEAEQMLMRTQY